MNIDINKIISNAIQDQKNIFIGKLGSVEATALYLYDNFQENINLNTAAHGWTIGQALKNQAGVYPMNTKVYSKWARLYLNSAKDLDYVLEWCPEYGDKYIIEKYLKDTTIFHEWIGYETLVS